MALVLHIRSRRAEWWLAHLRALLPELEVRPWDDPGPLDAIRYAVVWQPPAGGLKRFPNLACIVSIGAGIDHVLADPELPAGVPIIRTTSPELTQRMREYVLLHVLRLHRGLADTEAAQARREWRPRIDPPAHLRRVGVMGLGNLGGDCARALAVTGFDVAGWARTAKTLDGIATFAGEDGLDPFLERSEILVNLLPLTPVTHGILDARLFARLPAGASVINAARGEHLVEADLLAALDEGHLAAATLDVFATEPLPPEHPFWAHPAILVTPHEAALVDPATGGAVIAANLRRFIAGEPVADLVDLAQGY